MFSSFPSSLSLPSSHLLLPHPGFWLCSPPSLPPSPSLPLTFSSFIQVSGYVLLLPFLPLPPFLSPSPPSSRFLAMFSSFPSSLSLPSSHLLLLHLGFWLCSPPSLPPSPSLPLTFSSLIQVSGYVLLLPFLPLPPFLSPSPPSSRFLAMFSSFPSSLSLPSSHLLLLHLGFWLCSPPSLPPSPSLPLTFSSLI